MKSKLGLSSIFFLLTCFLLPTALSSTDRGIGGIRASSKQGKSFFLYKDYYALVIGVSNYQQWPKLPNAAKDAKEVAAKLKELGFNVELLLDPTSREMKKTLNEMIYKIGIEKNRAILLYYAGHGETETMADKAKMGYIIPKDCPLITQDPLGFATKAISMTEIESISLRIKSKHVLMLFDSCFSGSLFTLVRAVPDDITEKSALPVRQYITAGKEDEAVPDQSMFKRSFLIGLEGDADLTGDGYITGTELGMYLSEKVVNYSHRMQHPQYGKINNPNLDRGDFIFVPRKELQTKPIESGQKLLKAESAKKRIDVSKKTQRPVVISTLTGAHVAEIGFPEIGTRYVYKTVTGKKSYIRTYTVINDGVFDNKHVHRIAIEGKGKVDMYDKVSKNWIAQTADGKITRYAKPHEDLYRFPLYVGKKYKSRFLFSEKDRDKNINNSIEVKSFEKINVPAGTFEVFKLTGKRKGVKKTYWYSPELKIYVKKWEKHHKRGERTIELIEYRKL